MTRIRFTVLAFPVLLGLVLSDGLSAGWADIPPPGEEFPVAWWAQNHVPLALQIFRHTTVSQLGVACKSGKLKASPEVSTAWRAFAKGRRRQFCRKYPGPTHHLLGEAPYFMLSPPGAHK